MGQGASLKPLQKAPSTFNEQVKKYKNEDQKGEIQTINGREVPITNTGGQGAGKNVMKKSLTEFSSVHDSDSSIDYRNSDISSGAESSDEKEVYSSNLDEESSLYSSSESSHM
mmetsp:Transcript_10988/g.9728  ORF Transcript_10988/g.9728 Transcript_10988/m.9728 type:complete len:113 (+) Transcript_10988:99-437(+)